MIKINKFVENTCELWISNDFPDPDSYIGIIDSYLVLTDIRIQISEQQLERYYIMFKGKRINIDKRGYLSEWPKGFFDLLDLQLEKLLCK